MTQFNAKKTQAEIVSTQKYLGLQMKPYISVLEGKYTDYFLDKIGPFRPWCESFAKGVKNSCCQSGRNSGFLSKNEIAPLPIKSIRYDSIQCKKKT